MFCGIFTNCDCQDDLPVSVITVAGEASLQLTGSLDKEGVTGPASLIVGKYHIILV